MRHRNKTNQSLPTITSILFARRDEQGVLRVPIDYGQSVRSVLACIYIALGVIAGSFGTFFFVWGVIHHRFLWGVLILIAEGSFLSLAGVRSLWLWRKLRRLTSKSVLCERFNLDSEQLELIAAENGIRPHVSLVGHDYYSLGDFGDITTLLRASQQPTTAQETLLRPTLAGEYEQTAPEQLLRAAE